MKLFCFLMALVLANVLAVTKLEHKKQVYTTNCNFEKISGDERKVDLSIKNLICSGIPIGRLSLMLVVPEHDLKYIPGAHIHPVYVTDEKIAQNRLKSDHNIEDSPDTEDIPDTTPEDIEEIPGLTLDRIGGILETTLDQNIEDGPVTEEIPDTTPENIEEFSDLTLDRIGGMLKTTVDRNVDDNSVTTPDHILNITWQDLGKNRRKITNPSFLRLLAKVESESQTGLDDDQKCLLVGLYLNGILPKYRIFDSEIDVHDGHHDCLLTDNLRRISIIRKFDDGFWRVKNDYSQYYKLTDPNIERIINLEEYKTQVYSTNVLFGLASADESKLDLSIETLIRSDIPIKRLSLMLVVPESIVTKDVHDFIPPENEDDEDITQKRLITDYDIQNCPDTTHHQILDITWKDLGKNRRKITNPSFLRLLNKVEKFEIDEDITQNRLTTDYEIQNFPDTTPDRIEEIPISTTDGESQTELTNDQKCLLVGLYVNGRVPKKRIVNSETVVHNGHLHCKLTDNLNFVSIFRKFEDGFWKLKDDYTQHHKLVGRNFENCCDVM